MGTEEKNVEVVKQHNHIPDFGAVNAAKLMAGAKKRCTDEPNLLPALLSREAYSRADDEALVALPKENSLKKALRRLRRSEFQRLPASLQDLENIPETYQVINGNRWLMHDSADNDHRFLMFGRASATNAMSRSRIWFMDGTFKSRPLLFAQLFVIHYDYQDHVIPGVYILMESKSERAYHDVFTVLQQQLPPDHRHGPQHFSVDFELASANAFKEVFIGATEEFCFFHFAQSM